MTWRFRKSVKLFPGVRVNISKRGFTTTLGVRGASVNVGRGGTHLNVGIPGTGLSHRTKLPGPQARGRAQMEAREHAALPPSPDLMMPASPAGELRSAETESLTSEGLLSVKQTLIEAFRERATIQREVAEAQQALESSERELQRLKGNFIWRLFRKGRIAELEPAVEENRERLEELQQQLSLCVVRIDINFDEAFEQSFTELARSFEMLTKSAAIWDTTSSVAVSRAERSAAAQAISRSRVGFDFRHVGIVNSETPALHLANANGGDIFIYPGFIALLDRHDFALIDIKDVRLDARPQRFMEEESIPPDGKVIGRTWAKVNKDGGPDRRFKDNYEIPIVEYGELRFESRSGLNEVYMISNAAAALSFGRAFSTYQSLVGKLPT